MLQGGCGKLQGKDMGLEDSMAQDVQRAHIL